MNKSIKTTLLIISLVVCICSLPLYMLRGTDKAFGGDVKDEPRAMENAVRHQDTPKPTIALAHGKKHALSIVRNGVSKATIVKAAKSTPAVELATRELQHFIELITGVKLEIVDDTMETKGYKIVVGESRHTEDLGHHIHEFGYMDTLIDVKRDAIYILGRDEHENEHMPTLDYNRARRIKDGQDEFAIPGLFDYQGSLRATYRFLEEYCDLHILGVSDLAIEYKPRKTLKVEGGVSFKRSSLQTKQGGASHAAMCKMFGIAEEAHNRLLYQKRMRWGGKPWYINHTFEHMKYKKRFLKAKKPTDVHSPHYHRLLKEYEANEKLFERELLSGKNGAQFCFSQESLIEQVAQDARDFFDNKIGDKGDKYIKELAGRADVFPVVPYDCGNYCKCSSCVSLQQVGADRLGYGFNNGMRSEYVFDFVNKVAKRVAKTHPDKWIGTLAYEEYFLLPPKTKLDKNVAIAPCLHSMYWSRSPKVKDNEEGAYKEWLKLSQTGEMGPMYMWNYDFPITYQVYYAEQRGSLVKGWLNDGVQGIFHCGGPEPVGFYVTNKMYEDKNLDPKAVVDQYFSLFFGDAQDEMRKFYETMVDLTSKIDYYPLSKRGAYIHIKLIEPDFVFSDENMVILRSLLESAKRATKSKKILDRISLWEKNIVDEIEGDAVKYRKEQDQNIAMRSKGKKLAKHFIPSVKAYPAEHWFASRNGDSLVDETDMTYGHGAVTGSKGAGYKPHHSGFLWPRVYLDYGAWIMFDLGALYELQDMHIYNYNDHEENVEYGMKNIEIGYAETLDEVRSDAWTLVKKMKLSKADKKGSVGADGIVKFGGKKVRYVYIKAFGEHGEINWRPKFDKATGRKIIYDEFEDSQVGLGKVRFYGKSMQAEKPTYEIVCNDRDDGLSVLLSPSTSSRETLRYTLNGGIPTKTSPIYRKGIEISGNATVRARSFVKGKLPSDHIQVVIDFDQEYRKRMSKAPTHRLKSFDRSLQVGVELEVPHDDAVIRYTIDGSEVSLRSKVYKKPFIIDKNVTLKAKSYVKGMVPSLSDPVHIDYMKQFRALLENYEVAKGKPVSASGSDVGYEVEKMNDGIEGKSSCWWSKGDMRPFWGTIDLEKVESINAIWLQTWWDDGEGGRHVRFHIDAYVDPNKPTKVVDQLNNSVPSTERGEFHLFDHVRAKYVTIYDIPWLCELKVYSIPKDVMRTLNQKNNVFVNASY